LYFIIVIFNTSTDSVTFILGMQTSYGSIQPSTRLKIVWGVSLSAIAVVLLLAGGEEALSAIQSAATIAAFPFSVVVILMVFAFSKDSNNERKNLGLTIRPDETKLDNYLHNTPEEHSEEVQNYIEETSEDKGI